MRTAVVSDERIDFAQFGSDFVTRRQGERAREMLVRALEGCPGNERVAVSLAGIGAMTPSFADECFGKLLLSFGACHFKNRIAFVDADDTTKALLNAVLSKRAEETATQS